MENLNAIGKLAAKEAAQDLAVIYKGKLEAPALGTAQSLAALSALLFVLALEAPGQLGRDLSAASDHLGALAQDLASA